ncbi:MAG: nucleotide exchange factor GrpE [Clostridia bacterium]|nr:nucleotide exchange factor GrpE [Clostridia bacterium]
MAKEQTAPETTEEGVPATEPEEKPVRKKKKASAETEELKKQLAELQEQYTRMLAEYANYKRRTEQEKEALGAFTKAETLRQILPALDNLERAAAADDGAEYKKGVDMTIQQLFELLSKLGLEEIDAAGAPFDPEIHHAVMREDADGVEPDTVTEVFQKGYKVGDRVIRPAMVKVAN